MEKINDKFKWNQFVEKLISQTKKKVIKWKDKSSSTNRENNNSSIFVGEIKDDIFVSVYRYKYNYYTGTETFETLEEVAIEIVDASSSPRWRLPQVNCRYELIDLIEFQNSGAENILEDFLKEEA